MPYPLKQGDIIEFLVHDLGSQGEGVGSYEGLKIFIERAIPGERVVGKVVEVKKSYAKASLHKILETSSQRVVPPCPFYNECGGCQIQHLSHEFQLEMKTRRVEQAIRRIAKIEDIPVLPCVPSPKNFGYRNKIQFPVSPQNKLGLYKKSSHEIIPIDYCLLHLPVGESLFSWLQKEIPASGIEPYDEVTKRGELRHVLIRSTIHTEQALVGFVTTKRPTAPLLELSKKLREAFPRLQGVVQLQNAEETNRVLSSQSTLLFGKNEIQEKIEQFTFAFSLESFFQVNPLQAENLYKTALQWADVTSSDRVLDAFCGVGTLASFFSQKAGKVFGVECVPQAIENAKKNAKLNQITNCEFTCGDIDRVISRFSNMDWVILNPPRKGCSEQTLARIAASEPKGIVYVSCDPATLARDLAYLSSKGYQTLKIQPFDMFPQTMHVETLVILKNRRREPL